ncbi:MAG: TonB-dependent receptor plug domain-containing protein, partial [Muribaculaceae bacterium]|nr:TonB-dependent receptor plug domain-containing protein [Muribaculaceae bacterium]
MKKASVLLAGALTAMIAQAQVAADSMRTHHLSELVITGSNNAVGKNLLPYTVSTVGGKQLEATGNTQLLSAVSGLVPSLFVSERNIIGFGISNGGSGGIKIRGVGGSPTNAVLMMVDGQPQFAGIYSHHVADFYETEYVDHVEVLRGPASVLYGSNAMGGVINVITKNAVQEGVRTTLTSQYGSYNTWLSSLTNTIRFGKFSSLVSFGYDRTDGVKKNFDFRQGNLYAKVGYDFTDNWNIRADYSLMQFKGNDPVYPTLSNPESTDVYY